MDINVKIIEMASKVLAMIVILTCFGFLIKINKNEKK